MGRWIALIIVALLAAASFTPAFAAGPVRADGYPNYTDIADADELLFWRNSAVNLGNMSGLSFKNWLNGRYSALVHVHGTLPTTDQKAAMDNANSPSASNAFATVADIVAGGGGEVSSVNGMTGAVALDADDIGDGPTKSIPLTASQSNWNLAYSWGNHSELYEPIDATLMRITDLSAATDSSSTTTPASSAAVKAVMDAVNSVSSSAAKTAVQETIQSVSSAAGTVTVDISSGGQIDLTLTEDATIDFTGGSAALDKLKIILFVRQDATGGHGLAFGTSTAASSTVAAPAIAGSANALSLVSLMYDHVGSRFLITAYNVGY